MKKVEATISLKGEVKLETFGYTGKSCMDVDKALKALSGNIQTSKKSEYFNSERPEEVNVVGTN